MSQVYFALWFRNLYYSYTIFTKFDIIKIEANFPLYEILPRKFFKKHFNNIFHEYFLSATFHLFHFE